MPSSDYTATLEGVAAILPTRTRSRGGRELGTFTDAVGDADAATRPTATQVTDLIDNALSEVQDAIGTTDPPAVVWPAVRGVVALYAAMLVELTYFPEQVASGKSPYSEYKGLYDERLPRLVKAVERAEAGDTGPSSDIMPLFSFPGQAPDLVYRQSSLGSQADPTWTEWVQGDSDRPSGGLIGFSTNW